MAFGCANLSSLPERAVDAPIVRRLFTSSPRDPRYHMLSYISSKFSQLPRTPKHEPRAALFLNRFTRTLTIMYATNGVTEILGVTPQQLVSRSFYFCIQEDCLKDAVHCLESAKANNSIAYLRFWYRDPLQDDVVPDTGVSPTERLPGVQQGSSSKSHSVTNSPHVSGRSQVQTVSPIEVEAVVSCTSDGLVVVLRRTRSPIPRLIQQTCGGPMHANANGLFASPWATHPILPQPHSSLPINPRNDNPPASLPAYPSIYPGYNSAYATTVIPTPMTTPPSGVANNSSAEDGSHSQSFLETIRDVAVFAWGVIGINGSLERYKSGIPTGESLPAEGVQIWEPPEGYGDLELVQKVAEKKRRIK
ncbi:hypothetical protein VTN77DRAFT_1796 [Rasamsonia byssochlamydoides]|uniref:uncharacterized protein n=1 Tax=Rasamsonia byssochlamydoides TaxID=89139 RepID=UPI0037420740